MLGIIVAYSKNRIIGKDGKIPWYLPNERDRFRELTISNTVIMGRKTFQEIGKPLRDRFNIVLSKKERYSYENLITLTSLEEALSYSNTEKTFVIGGSKLYEKALEIADILYITEIDDIFDGDRYFPEFDENLYKREVFPYSNTIPRYRYLTYRRL